MLIASSLFCSEKYESVWTQMVFLRYDLNTIKVVVIIIIQRQEVEK